jgi:ATP-dependent RNA circularization protein (DNA/RNA ligase family)
MFFKFPHTPHLVWLAKTPCREDKVLSAAEVNGILQGEITVEEKVDGTNLGFSIDQHGHLQVQNRGNFLTRGSHPQFQPLWPWIDARRHDLIESLRPDLMLFGEWCFAHHSVAYQKLPDWFLAFDIYDRSKERFWSVDRRDRWIIDCGLSLVPRLARGRFTLDKLLTLANRSRLGAESMEGIYLRRDGNDWLEARAKIVRPEFVESIGRHWSELPLEKNSLASPSPK